MIRAVDQDVLKNAIRTLRETTATLRRRFHEAVMQASPLPPMRVKLTRDEERIYKHLTTAEETLNKAETLLGAMEVKNES